MVITFYFIISWMMMGLFIFNRKKSWGSIREVSFLILLSCLINTHTYLGLFETFKWIKTTTNPKLYGAFLFFRSVFIPFFISYFTLLIFNQPLKKKVFSIFIYSVIMLILDKIGLTSNMYVFQKWNLFFTILYYLIFLGFALVALRWFRSLERVGPEVKTADDVD